MISRKWYYCFS